MAQTYTELYAQMVFAVKRRHSLRGIYLLEVAVPRLKEDHFKHEL
ncbi:MAG TPA: hypothetical protein VG537_03350 [Candidatus Kapabacteria bacterium]|nr:hypothetical protein [Candidatus Kapabacteria bacterium]